VPKILYFNEEVSFLLKNKRKINKWIYSSIQSEDEKPGAINYIFCSDNYLLKLNQKYLNHNNYTDIITFENDDRFISGDIFISVDRVTENARELDLQFEEELHRVMIHGVLHLIGYKDKSEEEKRLMTKKEDYYLSLLPNFIH
jgi:rRNA maturation RNase YbeY